MIQNLPVCFPLNWHHPAQMVCCSLASYSSEQKCLSTESWEQMQSSVSSSQVPPECPEMRHHNWQTLGTLHKKACLLTNRDPFRENYQKMSLSIEEDATFTYLRFAGHKETKWREAKNQQPSFWMKSENSSADFIQRDCVPSPIGMVS